MKKTPLQRSISIAIKIMPFAILFSFIIIGVSFTFGDEALGIVMGTIEGIAILLIAVLVSTGPMVGPRFQKFVAKVRKWKNERWGKNNPPTDAQPSAPTEK